jgi:hypothetical protein
MSMCAGDDDDYGSGSFGRSSVVRAVERPPRVPADVAARKKAKEKEDGFEFYGGEASPGYDSLRLIVRSVLFISAIYLSIYLSIQQLKTKASPSKRTHCSHLLATLFVYPAAAS